MNDSEPWPAISYDEWAPTQETLHLYTQMIGKLKLALHPALPQWLHTGLLLDARGFATRGASGVARSTPGAVSSDRTGAPRLTQRGQPREAALGGRDLAHRLLQGRLGQRPQLVHLDDVVGLAVGADGVGVVA